MGCDGIMDLKTGEDTGVLEVEEEEEEDCRRVGVRASEADDPSLSGDSGKGGIRLPRGGDIGVGLPDRSLRTPLPVLLADEHVEYSELLRAGAIRVSTRAPACKSSRNTSLLPRATAT